MDASGAAARGVAGGTVATLAMSAFMLAARRAGWLHRQAAEEITERTVERATKRPVGGAALDLLATIAHVGFGALAGAVYVILLGRWRPDGMPPAVNGAVYGTVVWITSYWGVLPSVDLIPPPPADERRRPLVMLVAHWIYGAALGMLAGQRSPRGYSSGPG